MFKSLVYLIFLLSFASCASPGVAKNTVVELLLRKKLPGRWMYFGPHGKASLKPMIEKSYVQIGSDGVIFYRLNGEDRAWCNEFPKVDFFSNCKGVEQENGTIVELTDEEIKVNGVVFSPSLSYELSEEGSHLKIQDINLYR